MRQYALDHGADGIRSNAVNADRIRSGLLTDEMIAQRSKARGLSEADYMGGNLLGLEVTADDVAQAFVSLAKAHQDDGRCGDGRRRKHRSCACVNIAPGPRLRLASRDRSMTIEITSPHAAYRRAA